MDKKKSIIAITTLVLGLIMLVVGAVFLILNLISSPAVQDGEFLVSQDKWVLENEDKVEWDFTELGKGTLTTNGHENDYDFKWAIEDGKLKIQTDWLYEIENEYDYELDQGAKKLTLRDEKETYTFVAE